MQVPQVARVVSMWFGCVPSVFRSFINMPDNEFTESDGAVSMADVSASHLSPRYAIRCVFISCSLLLLPFQALSHIYHFPVGSGCAIDFDAL